MLLPKCIVMKIKSFIFQYVYRSDQHFPFTSLAAVSQIHQTSMIYFWHWFILQASSQSLFGTDLNPVGPPSLTPEVPSDVFAHSGECAAQSYSNMEEVD